MTTVIQTWIAERCSWKEQTVLMSAFRGCDGEHKGDVSKNLLHNYRATIMNDADPSSPFMQKRDIHLDVFCENLDHYPMHFLFHLLHGTEVIGYRHPNPAVAAEWRHIYETIVHALHLQPETNEMMTERLKDKR